jgi:hypothetical protein
MIKEGAETGIVVKGSLEEYRARGFTKISLLRMTVETIIKALTTIREMKSRKGATISPTLVETTGASRIIKRNPISMTTLREEKIMQAILLTLGL